MTIWADIQTKNGFASDEVQSSLQKYIRRAKVEEACQAAYELYTSGPVFLDKMWSRLETIAVEDVGFGDLNVPVLIHALDQMRKNFPYNDGDQPMYFIHAIRVLCTCTKDRSSDYLKNIIIKESAMGKVVEIPDIALDKHTKRGQEMGRGSKHFFEEATKVIPQLEIDNDYRERYGKILEGFDHMLDSIYSAVERMADCVYEHPRLKKKLLELESLVLLRIESLHDRDLSVTEDIDREINRLGFNIEYADNGRLDLIVDDGHLKHDPVEWTARWEEVVDEADRIVDRKLAGHPRGMGFCFAYWHERKIALGKFGVDWRSPAEMNPGVMFD